MTAVPRRGVLGASLLLALAAPAARAAAADAPPDIAVACEPPLAPLLRAVAAQFRTHTGVRVAVLTAPAMLILAQVERQTRTDLLVLPSEAMDAASRKGLVQPATRRQLGRNPLVFAALAGTGEVQADSAALLRQLGNGRLAATDPTPAATFDGLAALDRLGLLTPLAGRVIGAANTGDVAFLIRTGAARFGLLPLTEVRADPALSVALAADPARLPPIPCAAALSRGAESPRARDFLDFLVAPEAASHLRAAGLEAPA